MAGLSECWVCFAWVCELWSWCVGSCLSCLLLCFAVVVPVAEGADVVDGGSFTGLPLGDVCCFEVGGFWAACSVALCLGASVAVSFEAGVSDCGGDVGGSSVLPCHVSST